MPDEIGQRTVLRIPCLDQKREVKWARVRFPFRQKRAGRAAGSGLFIAAVFCNKIN
jgi:hypothetical protein